MFYRPGSVRPMRPKPIRGKSDLSSCTGNFSNLEKKNVNVMSEFKMSQTQGGIQHTHRTRTQETFT